MRKQDVTFHAEMWQEPVPAVNVKVRASFTDYMDAAMLYAQHHISDSQEAGAFVRSYAELPSKDQDGWLFPTACEISWEMLNEDAKLIFSPHVEVESQGRSGGWAVVRGLPPFASWDAIDLSKWARFARNARAYADDVPYQMAALFYLNVFEPEWARSPRNKLAGVGVGL